MTPSERVTERWREHALEGWEIEKYKFFRPRIYGPVVWESEAVRVAWMEPAQRSINDLIKRSELAQEYFAYLGRV